MDFGRAITYITEDERWLNKLGIGSLVLLGGMVIAIPFVWLIGYQVAIMRNVIAGEQRPLPEWDDWGKMFMDGLFVTIAMIVYTMPFLLLVCVGMIFAFLPALGVGGGDDLVAMLGAMTALVWVIIGCLSFLFIIALMFISPAVYIQYARTNELAACFRLGEVFAIARDNFVNILITVAANIGANFVLQTVAGLLAATVCGIVLAIPLGLFGAVWILAMLAHFYGQMGALMNGGQKEAVSW
jgi:hypothetical protein